MKIFIKNSIKIRLQFPIKLSIVIYDWKFSYIQYLYIKENVQFLFQFGWKRRNISCALKQ